MYRVQPLNCSCPCKQWNVESAHCYQPAPQSTLNRVTALLLSITQCSFSNVGTQEWKPFTPVCPIRYTCPIFQWVDINKDQTLLKVEASLNNENDATKHSLTFHHMSSWCNGNHVLIIFSGSYQIKAMLDQARQQ
jgi:hypothetical protein